MKKIEFNGLVCARELVNAALECGFDDHEGRTTKEDPLKSAWLTSGDAATKEHLKKALGMTLRELLAPYFDKV